jgi:hypothetical protein
MGKHLQRKGQRSRIFRNILKCIAKTNLKEQFSARILEKASWGVKEKAGEPLWR